MGDRELRARERALAIGGPDDLARLWIERLRSGQITRAELQLAAYMDDEGATRACVTLGFRNGRPRSFSRWVRELRRWGKAPCVRAALAVAREATPRLRERARVEASARRLERWLKTPCRVLVLEAQLSVPAAQTTACTFPGFSDAESVFISKESEDIARALHLVLACEQRSGRSSYGGALLAVVRAALFTLDPELQGLLLESEARGAIQHELLAWLDPRLRS